MTNNQYIDKPAGVSVLLHSGNKQRIEDLIAEGKANTMSRVINDALFWYLKEIESLEVRKDD